MVDPEKGEFYSVKSIKTTKKISGKESLLSCKPVLRETVRVDQNLFIYFFHPKKLFLSFHVTTRL